MRCITANMLQTKVDAECDGACMRDRKLTTLVTVAEFRVIVSDLSKVASFNLIHLHLATGVGGDSV